jgi:alpha-tubulin suppressor-like RCC1 family protein
MHGDWPAKANLAAPSTLNAIRIPNLQDSATGYFDVACGENHSLKLTDQLEIVSCGSNIYG